LGIDDAKGGHQKDTRNADDAQQFHAFPL